jgi:DNA-binding MarR family transcriptional regulator
MHQEDDSWDRRIAETRQCHCLAARKRSREITRRYEAALREYGLKATQFTVLAALYQAGAIAISELAGYLSLERTTLTRVASVMEAQGWVRIDVDTEDKRVRRLTITETGREKLKSAYPAWKAMQDSLDTIVS